MSWLHMSILMKEMETSKELGFYSWQSYFHFNWEASGSWLDHKLHAELFPFPETKRLAWPTLQEIQWQRMLRVCKCPIEANEWDHTKRDQITCRGWNPNEEKLSKWLSRRMRLEGKVVFWVRITFRNVSGFLEDSVEWWRYRGLRRGDSRLHVLQQPIMA